MYFCIRHKDDLEQNHLTVSSIDVNTVDVTIDVEVGTSKYPPLPTCTPTQFPQTFFITVICLNMWLCNLWLIQSYIAYP